MRKYPSLFYSMRAQLTGKYESKVAEDSQAQQYEAKGARGKRLLFSKFTYCE